MMMKSHSVPSVRLVVGCTVFLVLAQAGATFAQEKPKEEEVEADTPPSPDEPKSAEPHEAAGEPRSAETGRDKLAKSESEREELEEIVVVGSRRLTRSEVGSLSPVDLLSADDFRQQGSTDLNDMLRVLVPAFNVNQQPISDAATLMRPPNLRGLPPDSTLVLVNGKRRHRGAVIVFLGGGISDGAQGVDLAVIPAIALSRVEVLRDGASAQYGADAIAGVMNFVLRTDREGLRFESRYGSTYEGDGDTWTIAANLGLPLTDHGFANLSLEYGYAGATSRSVQRADAAGLIDAGNMAVADPAQVWGNPEVDNNLKLFGNFGLDLDKNTKAYLFGNYASRSVLGGFYFRNPNTRGGVFSNDDGQTWLVGDLTPDDGMACPVVSVGDTAGLQAVMDDPNCFVFNELFPGGFTPQFGGDVTDWSVVGGVRGFYDFGLTWDLSAGVGQSQVDFLIKNTINASLGPDTPTIFHPGTYRQLDKTFGLDLVLPLKLGFLHSPPIASAGLEFREEEFEVISGNKESHEIGPLFDQGFSIGSNGFAGFSEQQEGTFKRSNVAGYLGVEADLLDRWAVMLAGRVEHFDTFGTTATFKASTRFNILRNLGGFFEDLSVRATAGTGFRAPTPGQGNVTNVSTVADETGKLVNRGTIPPTNPIAMAVGGRELEPERAVNVGGGIVVKLSSDLTLTGDYYRIKVKDRIAQSATQMLTPQQAAELEALGIRGATDLQEFRFFTNAFATTTQGVDFVGTYSAPWAAFGTTTFSLIYNWNRTRVDSFTPGVIDATRITELEDGLPKHRVVFAGNHQVGSFRFATRLNYFGNFKNPEFNVTHWYSPRLLLDLEASFRLLENFNVTVGVQNLLNTFPGENPDRLLVGALYPETSPFGTDGGFWYTRLQGDF